MKAGIGQDEDRMGNKPKNLDGIRYRACRSAGIRRELKSKCFCSFCSVKPKLPEKFEKWKDWKLLWAVLILFLSAFFTERAVQYLLVEPGNRGKLSNTNDWLNIYCCLIILLVAFVITASVRVSAIAGHLSLMILAFISSAGMSFPLEM